MKKGRLILIPSFLDESNDRNSIIPYNLELIYGIKVFIVEQIRTTRRFLKKIGYPVSFDQVKFMELNNKTSLGEPLHYLGDILEGQDIGLISEAGSPCVADPGSEIVRLAHQKNIQVLPLAGFSSIILALMASGFNGQSFAFHGYLPVDKQAREIKLREIENNSSRFNQTQIFMETPYRNNQMMDSVISACHSGTFVCIAASLTSPDLEFIQTKQIREWRKNKPDLHKKPVMFVLYAGKL
jgi:16S rRNA (cytidine1402-2'-O)-methyltransferase